MIRPLRFDEEGTDADLVRAVLAEGDVTLAELKRTLAFVRVHRAEVDRRIRAHLDREDREEFRSVSPDVLSAGPGALPGGPVTPITRRYQRHAMTNDEDEDDVLEQIEYRLMSHGVYVDRIDRTDDGISVEYESIGAGTGDPRQQIGRVINVFREFADQGEWTVQDIEATVKDLDGNPQGSWAMDADWLEALDENDLSEVEFSQRVLATIEPPDAEGGETD